MSLSQLVRLSRLYGADPEWVLAGGGNTSYKTQNNLWIKASGTTLATIESDGFVMIDRDRLQDIWSRDYPDDSSEREQLVLADLLASRSPGADRRPSVETLLHDLFPHSYVIHTHPTLINGMTCGAKGADYARELFGDEAVWIDQVEAGYLLARATRDALDAHRNSSGADTHLLFLANHGVVVAADDPEEVVTLHRDITTRCRRHVAGVLGRRPDLSEPDPDDDRDRRAAMITHALRDRYAEMHVRYAANRELLRFLESHDSVLPLLGAYTPDHIVYAGAMPLFVPVDDLSAGQAIPDKVIAAIDGSQSARSPDSAGSPPRCVLVQGTGLFSICPSARAAAAAEALFFDSAQIAFYSRAFGGHRFLRQDLVEFILGWEVERFRASIHQNP